MFIIHGRRVMRTQKFTDNRNFCKSCGSPNLLVRIYRQYFHVFWIPFFPTGNNSAHMECTSCGEPFRHEAIQNEHAYNSKRAPFYLYAGPLLFVGLVVLIIFSNAATQKEMAAFVANPKVGDVYRLRKDTMNNAYYHFMKVTAINGDTVFLCSNMMYYSRFVSRLSEEDYFDKSLQIGLPKSGLKKMLDIGEINSVERNYGDAEGFNRMK